MANKNNQATYEAATKSEVHCSNNGKAILIAVAVVILAIAGFFC